MNALHTGHEKLILAGMFLWGVLVVTGLIALAWLILHGFGADLGTDPWSR
jgi:hypothetical protein